MSYDIKKHFTYKGINYEILTDSTCAVAKNDGIRGDLIIPEVAYYNDKGYSVTEIGHKAFNDCADINSVNIPNSVTKIGEEAFRGCTGLKSVNIPNSVTEIGEEAFEWCSDCA